MTHRATLTITGDDTAEIHSPTVGLFRAALRPGAFIASGDTLGHIEILGRAEPVLVPQTPNTFQLRTICGAHSPHPIDYGAKLAVLVPASAGGEGFSPPRPPSAEGLPPNAIPILAPTDGLSDNAPSPDAPPFVTVGDTLTPGQIVGLVEVMKFFYEIRFNPPDPNTLATVARIIATDTAPIETGAPILYAVPV